MNFEGVQTCAFSLSNSSFPHDPTKDINIFVNRKNQTETVEASLGNITS